MNRIVSLVIIAAFVMGSFIMIDSAKVASARSMVIPDANNQYDPVTGQEIAARKYFTTHNGMRWWFNSQESRVEFKKNPSKYESKLIPGSASAKAATKTTKSAY